MIASNKAMDITVVDGAVLFWGGPFSQWYPEYNEATSLPSSFTIDDHTYEHAETWMMAEKARVFCDAERLSLILASDNPYDVKAHGRAVQNFDLDKWNAVARDVVFRGNLAKFSQNEALRDLLLSTGDLRIAEASPEDRIWGIGLAADDPRAAHPAQWQGTNWLGEALERVRDAIRTST